MRNFASFLCKPTIMIIIIMIKVHLASCFTPSLGIADKMLGFSLEMNVCQDFFPAQWGPASFPQEGTHCGRPPVCLETEDFSASSVPDQTAAGNHGRTAAA